MGRHSRASSPKAKFKLSDDQLFRKHVILIVANHSSIHRLHYYTTLENGLEIALHECPKHLDWKALRDGEALGSDAGSQDEVEEEEEELDGGVPGALMMLRRHYRKAEDEIRKSFFVPGLWSRSGAKQDLAESLRGARDEVVAAMEKCRLWWNADLVDKITKLSVSVKEEVVEPVKKSGHKDYYEITNKTDEFCSKLRHEIQAADKIRKEFISLAKDEVATDFGLFDRAMHKHFEWRDIRISMDRR